MNGNPIDILRPDGRELPENHHLDYRSEKGDFRMKVTVNVDGDKFVGRRILIPLHTRDVTVARKIRDGVIVALSKAGVLSRNVNLIEENEEPSRGDNSTAGNTDRDP